MDKFTFTLGERVAWAVGMQAARYGSAVEAHRGELHKGYGERNYYTVLIDDTGKNHTCTEDCLRFEDDKKRQAAWEASPAYKPEQTDEEFCAWVLREMDKHPLKIQHRKLIAAIDRRIALKGSS